VSRLALSGVAGVPVQERRTVAPASRANPGVSAPSPAMLLRTTSDITEPTHIPRSVFTGKLAADPDGD